MEARATGDIFLFGGFRLDRRGLCRRDERGVFVPVVIGSRAVDLLGVLIEGDGDLVLKDKIMAAVWPGTVVEDNNLTVQISALRRILDQGRAEGSCIQTVAGRGYRFAATVTRVEPASRPIAFAISGDRGGGSRAEDGRGASAALLPLPDKPSIAILPFANLSNDPDQEYFADGMVEEITTAVSRLSWLFVISRNSSFTFKGRAVDVKQVGLDFGVRYVLEGSVRKAGNRVRVAGQLIDTATGAQIWAEHIDGTLDDIFELQDQVASSVAGAIEPRLRLSEIERAIRKLTESLDAYDMYLRALAQFHKYSEEGMRDAVALMNRALLIDPSYAPAAAMIGWCRSFQRLQGWGPVSDAEVAEAARLARRAIEAGKDDPDTLWMAGMALWFLAGDDSAAIRAVERALSLNPNSALASWASGLLDCLAGGRADLETISSFGRALRLSPRDPLGWMFLGGLALAHLIMGNLEVGIELVDRGLLEQPRAVPLLRVKVALCGHLRLHEEGRKSVQQLLEIYPGLTVARWLAAASTYSPRMLEIYAEGFRKAGMPEE
jgi:TolB-like protein/DNA-binding winged helix-turn-helix (wHTH) protein